MTDFSTLKGNKQNVMVADREKFHSTMRAFGGKRVEPKTAKGGGKRQLSKAVEAQKGSYKVMPIPKRCSCRSMIVIMRSNGGDGSKGMSKVKPQGVLDQIQATKWVINSVEVWEQLGEIQYFLRAAE